MVWMDAQYCSFESLSTWQYALCQGLVGNAYALLVRVYTLCEEQPVWRTEPSTSVPYVNRPRRFSNSPNRS